MTSPIAIESTMEFATESTPPEKKQPEKKQKEIILAGPIKIDDRSKLVFIEGEEHHLSPKEYALLKLFAEDAGRVISNQEIIFQLWPENNRAVDSDVKQYIFLLRKRIEKNPQQPRWILNVKGFGYRLAI